MIIKKDDSREPYNRAKIENGILCHVISVRSPSDQITKMIDEIEKQIFSMEGREIPSVTIGELVMKNSRWWTRLHTSVSRPSTGNLRM